MASLQVEFDVALAASSAIVIDLTDAEFVDSTTLQALLQSHRAADDRDIRFAAVVPAGELHSAVVDLVGLAAVVATYPTRAAAVAAVTHRQIEDAEASA